MHKDGEEKFFHPIDVKHAVNEGWKEVEKNSPSVDKEIVEEVEKPEGASLAGGATGPEVEPEPEPEVEFDDPPAPKKSGKPKK